MWGEIAYLKLGATVMTVDEFSFRACTMASEKYIFRRGLLTILKSQAFECWC